MKKILSLLLVSLTCISCMAQSPQYVRKDQLPKAIADYISTKIVAGANVSIVYNSGTGTAISTFAFDTTADITVTITVTLATGTDTINIEDFFITAVY